MCAERLVRARLSLLLAVVVSAGCASSPTRPGHGGTLAFRPFAASAQGVRSAVGGVAGETGSASEAEGDEEPLLRRREPVADDGEHGEGQSPRVSGGRGHVACGGKALPSGWPHLDSSREVLAPFLACASPAEFVAMQHGVDMAALVESLTDWDSVRLGALGPLDARASEVLGRKRAAFLVTATEKYGVPHAEVLALFVLHSAFDDELRELVQLLARDKQVAETLGAMAAVREELKRRGLVLEGFPERGEQGRDVLRGLGRAGRDMLSSTLVSGEARYTELMALRGQLPPPYQAALDEVHKALMERHYSPGSVSAGVFDHLTFGVPVGFYHLVVGTGHGASSLAQGRYEQATRELAPAALAVAVYAGGKGARALVEARGGPRRLQMPALDVGGMKALMARLEEQLGINAARELLRYLQASREGALVAAEWGEAGLLALYEARGNPAKAQAMLAEASRESPSAASTRGVASRESARPAATKGAAEKRAGGADLFARNAEVSATEAAKAKLFQAELESSGPRLPKDVKLLKKLASQLNEPPPGVETGAALWREYVAYRKRRLKEIRDGEAVKGPLKWEGYEGMRAYYARGMAFENAMVAILEADAALPRAQRRWLGDFEQPRIETHVGVSKVDFRYVDVLVIEERPPPGQPPRVETFSFKSRNLAALDRNALAVQLNTDASNAMAFYGGTLKILRAGMRQQADVRRVRLVYEGKDLLPEGRFALDNAADAAQRNIKGVEVLFQ
ncbi:hypothetical protein HUW62_40595 [Myxococcus sp. AM011]|uniref:hypothetical protein n=1 Tax=Myxococcus sp. AM011 TaxID=2745200 RepID=UPI001595E4AD|nr:hypothetical protein [Myxococcus sp. AM011]NVJ27531.1 hypothetical protein [Myxococcus sp. AM011]